MNSIFDADGYIIMDEPKTSEPLTKTPKRATTKKAVAVSAPPAAIINAKLDALLEAQKIDPATIERQVMDEVTQ